MMTILSRRWMFLLLAGIMAGLWGCGSKEDLARRHYQSATAVEQSGDLNRAEGLYRRIISDYPQAEEAANAARQIENIQLRREQLHKEQFMPVLHRIRAIVMQYQQMTGTTPTRFSDFDRDDFPFGADHLARIVPPGFKVYLQVEPTRNSFLLYASKEGSAIGYGVDNHSPVLKPVEPTVLENRAASDQLATEKGGGIFFLRK